MTKYKRCDLKFSASIQKKVDEAFIELNRLVSDLEITDRTSDSIKEYIVKFYIEAPESRIQARTLVTCLTYLISSRNNEIISLSTLAYVSDISIDWLNKQKRKIARLIGFEFT